MLHTSSSRIRAGLLLAAITLIGLLPVSDTVSLAQSGGTIGYGAKVFGAITENVPRVTYSFPGNAGDGITVTVDNWTGTLDLRAELVAPNGLALASSTQNTLDDNLSGAYISAVLPGNGIYLLWISSENETTGDFTLTLLGQGAPMSTLLVFGQAVDVTLVPAAEPQLLSFEAEDCPTTLTVTNLSEGQPFTYPFVVTVRDQRGQAVALLRGGEQREDRVTVAPRSGRYEVEVSSDDLLAAGSVRLLVTCAADAAGCLGGGVSTGPAACAPCPGPDTLLDGSGCPDLNFAVMQDGDDPLRVTVTWTPVPGATGYAVYLYGRVADSGDMYLTHGEWAPGDPTAFTWSLPEDYISFRFVLRVYFDDALVCIDETGLEFETLPPSDGEEPQEPMVFPCAIRTDATGINVRVGPGLGYDVFGLLTPGVDYPVIGYASDSAGNQWWQIDKTMFAGHETVPSLWVAAWVVTAIGDCSQVPPGEVPPGGEPPVVPVEPESPDSGVPAGSWGACGSCDTCGHSARECVVSPDGSCLWDPSTCACRTITATVDMSNCQYTTASAMIDTAPNCDGGYAVGTVIEAHAVAVDPKCNVDYWSGCGASGEGNSIAFTATGSCTITAYMHYGN